MNISLHHKDDCHVLTVEDMETVNEINRDIITHSVMASCLMILLFVAPVLRQDRTRTGFCSLSLLQMLQAHQEKF